MSRVSDKIAQIVFGTDGSESAARAMIWVKDIAVLRQAAVTVVCAYDSPRAFRKRGSMYLTEARSEFEEEAKEISAEAVAELLESGIEARAVAYEGDAVDGILATADTDEADIIIIGRGGEGGRPRLLDGLDRRARHPSRLGTGLRGQVRGSFLGSHATETLSPDRA